MHLRTYIQYIRTYVGTHVRKCDTCIVFPFAAQNFDFVPQTFVLPSDMRLLKREWEEGGVKNKWIIKPVSETFTRVCTYVRTYID